MSVLSKQPTKAGRVAGTWLVNTSVIVWTGGSITDGLLEAATFATKFKNRLFSSMKRFDEPRISSKMEENWQEFGKILKKFFRILGFAVNNDY